ncbi:MAG: cysteine-rich small domain-containing protein [Clostridiales bacterium]|nr:cysteine-rich small domain-containing protein [Clostridiales bacterium]
MEHYKFFSNKECEYFPCHQVKDPDQFNCLFCYCPLYSMGDKCGGRFEILPNGVKSCMDCLVPHSVNGYDHIQKKLQEQYQYKNDKR